MNNLIKITCKLRCGMLIYLYEMTSDGPLYEKFTRTSSIKSRRLMSHELD